MNPAELSVAVKDAARKIGFDSAGITTAEPLAEGTQLREWLAAGRHAGMRWMGNPEIRENPGSLLPGAKSVVVVGVCSRTGGDDIGSDEGRLASFARFPDYHFSVGKMLEQLLESIRGFVPCQGKVAVDSRPLLERALARRAGLGWFGRSSCLVSPEFGPWLIIGEVVTDAEMEPDAPVRERCGECTRCRDACPSGALVLPGVVDANRCIAYLTVEHRGDIPASLHGAVGDRLFGCDACLRACPWGSGAAASPALGEPGRAGLPAGAFAAMSDGEFTEKFAGTPLLRAGRNRMARNGAVVLDNAIVRDVFEGRR